MQEVHQGHGINPFQPNVNNLEIEFSAVRALINLFGKQLSGFWSQYVTSPVLWLLLLLTEWGQVMPSRPRTRF